MVNHRKWKCQPCGHENNSKNVCMICGFPKAKAKVKIIKKNGKKIITQYSE